MVQFVKFEMSEDALNKVKNFLGKVLKTTGKIRAGVNEVTKHIERGNAKLVIMAEDVTPEELLLHIPLLCDEKKIPYLYYKERKELGEISGLKIKTSCLVVLNEGQAKKELDELNKLFKELKK